MRLLTLGNMYPPHRLGGYELMWSSWVQRAESQGHAVRVLTTDFMLEPPPADEAEVSADVCRELRWYWRDHEFPRLSPAARWSIERHNAKVLEGHLREFRPDAVLFWAMAGMSLSTIELVKRAGIPAVAVLADYWLQYAPNVDAWTRMFLSRPRLGRAVERVTGIPTSVDLGGDMSYVFVSEFVRQHTLRALPHLGSSEVVLHGPDTALFREQPAHDWHWDLLCVGRIDRRKGVDLAITALTHLPEAATLTVLGGGDADFLAELAELVERHDLGERVTFGLASREDLPAAYAAADVLLFPVRWAEPFGLVPVEAMAVGTPVIATGLGGSGEYLEHGSNCLLFDHERGAAELAARVRALADDAQLWRRLREGGLATAERLSADRFNERVTAAVERATMPASG